MSKRRILLTGDDGYQSHGTRLLSHFLKDTYDVTIAGTIEQQSGVGGKVSITSGFNWGKSVVDGVPAYWVDGTPVDAMELMSNMGQPPFDVVISGINWGGNFGASLMNSGTVNAAIGALGRGVAPKSIAISWDLPPEFYTMHHDKDHSLESYLDYPGTIIQQILNQAIEAELWGAQFLNINLPKEKTTRVQVTKPTFDILDVYDQVQRPVGQEGHYSFASSGRVFSKDVNPLYDVRAVTEGFISLTPCHLNFLHEEAYQKLQNVQFTLK